ncbi:MAG: exopolysaccharide biosynthesis protein [Alphaproteobacteria bacterium]|nr:exopolysaccharide biosynthesis protein [Alphaproteobacteria bacterium]
MARTSELLQRSIEARSAPRVSVAELMGSLGDRGFGLLIVLLVLPTLIPGPPIPFYSLPFAALIALVASQLARGHTRPDLPRFLRDRSFDRAKLDSFMIRAMPYVRRFERFAHARPSAWTTPRAERWIGALSIAVAIALAMPVPLGNTPPALSLLALGLGLIERDTRLLVIGALAGVASVIYVGVLSAMAVMAAGWIFG